MWRTFLQGGDINAADKYLAPEYHQHNPNAERARGVKAYFPRGGPDGDAREGSPSTVDCDDRPSATS
jgi:hypothetical protein